MNLCELISGGASVKSRVDSITICFMLGMVKSVYCEFGPGIKYKKFTLSCGLQKFGKDKGSSHFYVKTGFYF